MIKMSFASIYVCNTQEATAYLHVHSQAELSQMKLSLLLACILASPSSPGVAGSTHLGAWLASFTMPDSPPLREKVSRLCRSKVQHSNSSL